MSSALTPTNFKTLVIRPGETAVIKKSWNILKTINENVTASSTCSDVESRLNETTEELARYSIWIEVVNEFIGDDGLMGVGISTDFYPFASPIELGAFATTSPLESSGIGRLFKAMVDAFPSGSVLFRQPTYSTSNWNGPAGDSTRDNMYRGVVTFSSFPSIIEDLQLYILYKNRPSSGADGTSYNMRIYPLKES